MGYPTGLLNDCVRFYYDKISPKKNRALRQQSKLQCVSNTTTTICWRMSFQINNSFLRIHEIYQTLGVTAPPRYTSRVEHSI